MPRLTARTPGAAGTTPGALGPQPLTASRLQVAAALRRHAPYLVCGAAFWLVLAIVVFHTPIGGDFGQNAAAVARISENWRHPANPVIKEPGHGSPYFSPYLVALGLAARAGGAAAWEALRWSGLLNLAVLVTGVGVYARTLSRRPLAPVYALAAFTLLWGWQPEFWSGFCGLASLSQVAAYPSTFAVGLTFLLWAWTDRVVRRGGTWGAHAGLGALAGTLLLIHPITALAAATGVAATVVGRQRRRWTRHTAARWAVTLGVALVVAAAWPYFDVFALAGDTTVDAVHRRLYEQMLPWYGLALVGLPALAWRARRRWRDPLVLMFCADCAIAGYGWISGHYTYGRVFALLVVPPQFALAVELAEIPPWSRLRAVLAPLTVGALCVAFATQAGSVLPRGVLPALTRPAPWNDYRWVADRVPAGAVLLTDGYQSSHIMPAYGVYTVWPAWPDPSTSVADRDHRSVAVSSYFDPRTSAAARRTVVRRYDVGWLLLGRGEHVPYQGVVAARNAATGETLVRLTAG